jgi:hypothetical protein
VVLRGQLPNANGFSVAPERIVAQDRRRRRKMKDLRVAALECFCMYYVPDNLASRNLAIILNCFSNQALNLS